jgi:hypothetical protein
MIVYAAIMRYSDEKPAHLIVDTSKNQLKLRAMWFVKGVLRTADPELHEKIDWSGSSDNAFEQYIAFTTEGSRPVEFEYYGEISTQE